MAHSMDMKVIAEGVEHEDQLKLLKRLLVDQVQGHLISEPTPPIEIESMIAGSKDAPGEQSNIVPLHGK
jgi:EAL domain-containing protein (putative c-di-GMP-specific phosphodiesterase class I)